MNQRDAGLAALAAVLALAATACSAASEPEAAGTLEQPVIRGELSTDDQNSAVLIWNSRTAGWCSGAVVAPTLILTARHCLFNYVAQGDNFVECNESGLVSRVTGAYSPETLSVSIGKEVGKNLKESAVGINIYSGSELDLCVNDVGILEIDTPLDLPPYPLRLDTPPVEEERGTLIGWGATEADADATLLRLTDARRQREIKVLSVGPELFTPAGGTTRFIEISTFVGTEGGCRGDSGGPLISTETGAIFGVFHAMQNPDPTAGIEGGLIDQCLNGLSVFHRLDQQKDWIRRAFREAGQAPWIENRPFPAEFGASCELGDDCVSGVCVHAAKSAFCSMHCEESACPDGMQCVGPERNRVCMLPEVESAETPSDGCSIASLPRTGPLHLGALFAACTAAALMRRRKARVLRRPQY